jgi:hypothetical protein
MGAAQVTMSIRADDHHGIGKVVCIAKLSTSDAREIGARLIAEAEKADAMAAKESNRG